MPTSSSQSPSVSPSPSAGNYDMYWYGGTGNWSDYTNHWSYNSGNSPASPASAAPTQYNDVFINSSSGFGAGGTITLDEEAFVNDMSCTSGHTFTISDGANNKSITIGGNLLLESGMTISILQIFFGIN